MDVYIDFRRRDVNPHRSERVPTRWEQCVVCLFNRVGERLASYHPTIHHKGGVGPGVSVDNGRSADTGDTNRGLVNQRECQQVRCDASAIDCNRGFKQGPVTGGGD